MRFLNVWISDANDDMHFFQLLLGQEAEGEDPYKVVHVSRDSLSEQLENIRGTSFEEVLLKLASRWTAAAHALRVFASRAQASMDAGNATMTSIERATSKQIQQYLYAQAEDVKEGPEREQICNLAFRVSRGEWKSKREV